MFTKKYINELSYTIIGCAIEVHRELGPGLLESVYENCMKEEFEMAGLRYVAQKQVPVLYKGRQMDSNLRIDLLVEDLIIVELKVVESIIPVHQAQILTYMKLLEKPKGIIINFNCTNIFKEGQKTFVNEYYTRLTD